MHDMKNIEFEPVIGLEVHVQLATKSKLFCGCSTQFGAESNSHTCPVCMGFPGTLPVLNKQAVRLAVRAGLALNCNIQKVSAFDRKNYFYPDLPKAYQVSQMFKPICLGGHLTIETEAGEKKVINITRIHMEEDAGKLVHGGGTVGSAAYSYVDLNRSSIPLAEIVSEPEMRTAEEARLYMQKIRSILLYAGVSDCNMEEGSLRCDANVSVRPKGQEKFGTRVEIKNMNSFKNVQKAVEYEIKRQTEVIRGGGTIYQETRLWDVNKNSTYTMRSKEDAHDYRYFPEPDLLPLVITDEFINEVRKELPELPDERKAKFINKYGLSDYDADVLTADKSHADYFEAAVAVHNSPKALANWILSEALRYANDKSCTLDAVGVSPANIAELVKLVEAGTINGKQGKDVFVLAAQTGKNPKDIVKEQGIEQVSDTSEIEKVVMDVINANPAEAERYKNGDMKLQGFFVGLAMKASKGKANPKMVNDILAKLLK